MSDSLPIRHLTPKVSVAPQMTPGQMAEVARLGYRSVINNRPDFEGGPDQPTSADMAEAARAAGIEYRHQPVNGFYQSPEDVAEFAQLLHDLPAPVLVFCRSGARSTRLFAAAAAL